MLAAPRRPTIQAMREAAGPRDCRSGELGARAEVRVLEAPVARRLRPPQKTPSFLTKLQEKVRGERGDRPLRAASTRPKSMEGAAADGEPRRGLASYIRRYRRWPAFRMRREWRLAPTRSTRTFPALRIIHTHLPRPQISWDSRSDPAGRPPPLGLATSLAAHRGPAKPGRLSQRDRGVRHPIAPG
jgi:hypothetical protein